MNSQRGRLLFAHCTGWVSTSSRSERSVGQCKAEDGLPMPTNRTPIGRKSVLKITPEAIGAWKRADFDALHRLLGLAPWEASPLPYEITALGCSENDLPVEPGSRDWEKSIPKA